jgi:spore germination protein
MTTENGVEIFAAISQKDGALIYFDYYEECARHVHDVETAKNMAQSFLERLGYENMIPVRVDESGTNADFTFAYQADGCIYYPDEIVVKVCEERGVVSGLDASRYLKNHGDRYALSANITMEQAREKLSDRLTVEAAEMVLFQHKGREVLAYEFFCSFDGKLYFVYMDAQDGSELFIVNANNR